MWVRDTLSLTKFHKLTLLLPFFFSFKCLISIWPSGFSVVKFRIFKSEPFFIQGKVCKLFKFEKFLDGYYSMVLHAGSGLDLIILILLYFNCSLIIYITFILCAVGCILRMPGSPMVLFACVFCGRWGSVFGNSPKYKGNSAQTLRKLCDQGLLGNFSPMRRSRPGLGRDKDGIRALGFPVYYRVSVLW